MTGENPHSDAVPKGELVEPARATCMRAVGKQIKRSDGPTREFRPLAHGNRASESPLLRRGGSGHNRELRLTDPKPAGKGRPAGCVVRDAGVAAAVLDGAARHH